MWRRSVAATLRERNNPAQSLCMKKKTLAPPRNGYLASSQNAFLSSASASTTPTSTTVAVQLDYYMSLQFAGIACALVNNLYDDAAAASTAELQFLPTCPVGLEQERVRQFYAAHPDTVTVGTVEQNVFLPTLLKNPALRTTAVATMFRTSPLCVASLPPPIINSNNNDNNISNIMIGAHEDTVDLLQRIFPDSEVVASPRSSKITDLLNGTYRGIQAYTTTEVPTLRRLLAEGGRDPDGLVVTPLDGRHACLGYSQVIFVPEECLADPVQRSAVRTFLRGTSDGWAWAIRHPAEAIEAVRHVQEELRLVQQLEDNDHWHESMDYQEEMLAACLHHVKETFQGDRYGVLDRQRWAEANRWLTTTSGNSTVSMLGLDTTNLWQPSPQLLAGNELGRRILENAKASACEFADTHGRKPSLAVITVGELDRYQPEQSTRRRVELYSTPRNSWFTKTSTGTANGFDVQEITLDAATTTTEDLLSHVYRLRQRVDGLQVMWPLPDHIDDAQIYRAIPVDQDVDGAHYIGQLEIGNPDALAPVAPAATMALLEEYNVPIRGKRVLVIGRSRIVGSPLAHMLRAAGAAVTVAHSQVPVEALQELVGQADVVISCVGQPGLIPGEWLLPGSHAISVGTTFSPELDVLQSDFTDNVGDHASHYSPIPGGVGPLCAPKLFQNVAAAAWKRVETKGAVLSPSSRWKPSPAKLSAVYEFDTYPAALEFTNKLDKLSTLMDHHANLKFTHYCTEGVQVEVEFFTYGAQELTDKDYEAANAVDFLFSGSGTSTSSSRSSGIAMKDYTYNLAEDAIAKYPAEPRGSSKLLEMDSSGKVFHHDRFDASFAALVKARNAHLVFNQSLVLDARLFVKSMCNDTNTMDGNCIEVMILDLGDIDVTAPCKETLLRTMVRIESATKGLAFTEEKSSITMEIVDVFGAWEEDKNSGGNGTECLIRIHSAKSVEDFLSDSGSIPIPPYFNRAAEISDKERYNNVYAAGGGSVAAPTAGLHFTEDVLAQIGAENCSYLSLHVGAGTFKPVVVEDARDHAMHAESFSISVSELKRVIAATEEKRPLVVVGTTSCRTLESLFWCGVKKRLSRGASADGSDEKEGDASLLHLGQFDWVGLSVGDGKNVTREAAFTALLDGIDDSDGNAVISGRTSLMITPGSYKFKVVDHLVTNFHAPDSTLMLLVSAFVQSGEKIKGVYEDAQKKGYRFLSYGDVCLFSRPGDKK